MNSSPVCWSIKQWSQTNPFNAGKEQSIRITNQEALDFCPTGLIIWVAGGEVLSHVATKTQIE